MDAPFMKIGPEVTLGKDVRFCGFANLYGCVIGDACTIGPFVEIQRGARLGRRVKVQSHSFICAGVTIDDEAFIGHGVTFINDRFPRSTDADGNVKGRSDWHCEPTWVRRRASIGSNATILCGITIGEEAVVGAGSVVTRDVPAGAVVAGNPARVLRGPGSAVAVNSGFIPLLDLSRQHRALKDELLQVVADALDSGSFVGGRLVADFESDFAGQVGTRHACGVASGTDALWLALAALGVGPGSAVVTVPNTFMATAEAITRTGARLELVDVDPDTCLMDPQRLEDLLKARFAAGPSEGRPRAIVPVHLYGQCADMDAINTLARRYELAVVEDAAQAHGARYRGRPAGSLGDAAAFSFYPSKNLGACGEAGAVTTNDPELAERVRMLRDHGQRHKNVHELEGWNARLDALQAGFLRVKLRHLDEWNRRRRALAEQYDRALADLAWAQPVTVLPHNLSARHLYVVHTPKRAALAAHLRQAGSDSGQHYPVPLHLQPVHAALGFRRGQFPRAEQSAETVLSLPLFPEMDQDQLRRVIDAVQSFAEAPETIRNGRAQSVVATRTSA